MGVVYEEAVGRPDFRKASRFLERTKKNEEKSVRRGRHIQLPESKLLRAIIVFLLSPLIEIFVLAVVALAVAEENMSIEQVWCVVRDSADYIFLAFSLAFTVILEWTVSDPKVMATPYILLAEVVLGMLSLFLYGSEQVIAGRMETGSLLGGSALYAYRGILHQIFVWAVVLVAIIGYCKRYVRPRR